MKKITGLFPIFKYILLMAASYGIFKFAGCDFGPCYRNYGTHTTNIIRVDRVLLSRDTLNYTETQDVSLWDTIGTNSGYTFKGIQASRYQNVTDLTLNNALDIDCGATVKDTILVMTDYIYHITPPLSHGTNTVKIHQPDGGAINKYFYVR